MIPFAYPGRGKLRRYDMEKCRTLLPPMTLPVLAPFRAPVPVSFSRSTGWKKQPVEVAARLFAYN